MFTATSGGSPYTTLYTPSDRHSSQGKHCVSMPPKIVRKQWHSTPTGNIPETSELGTPLHNGQNFGFQWCPLLRGSTVVAFAACIATYLSFYVKIQPPDISYKHVGAIIFACAADELISMPPLFFAETFTQAFQPVHIAFLRQEFRKNCSYKTIIIGRLGSIASSHSQATVISCCRTEVKILVSFWLKHTISLKSDLRASNL